MNVLCTAPLFVANEGYNNTGANQDMYTKGRSDVDQSGRRWLMNEKPTKFS